MKISILYLMVWNQVTPAVLHVAILDMERRKTRDIRNNNYRLRPCRGPGWTAVLHLNVADPGNSCPSYCTHSMGVQLEDVDNPRPRKSTNENIGVR